MAFTALFATAELLATVTTTTTAAAARTTPGAFAFTTLTLFASRCLGSRRSVTGCAFAARRLRRDCHR